MSWKAMSEEPLGWVVWNGDAYHTTQYGDVVIGTRESMEDLAAWLNRKQVVKVSEAGVGPSDKASVI